MMRIVLSLIIGCCSALPASAEDIRLTRNVQYYDGPGCDEYRHSLDLFLPAKTKKFPTVVFVHGGGWSLGSKDGFLMLPGHNARDHGRFFAEKGIGCAQVNYRLAPKSKHPDHVVDVARSVAWVRRNIAQLGGDPDRIFLMGHSAGGHLVALLATDPKYLMAEGLTPNMIKGVIPVSGVFTLTASLGPSAGMPDTSSGASVFFGHAFGNNTTVYRDASPVNHVRGDAPPFLITFADRDLPTLAAQADAFWEAMAQKGANVKKLLVTGRSHQSILQQMLRPGDPLGEAVLRFVATGKPG